MPTIMKIMQAKYNFDLNRITSMSGQLNVDNGMTYRKKSRASCPGGRFLLVSFIKYA